MSNQFHDFLSFVESIASSIDGHARRVIDHIQYPDKSNSDLVWIKSMKDQKIIAIEVPESEKSNREFIRIQIKNRLNARPE